MALSAALLLALFAYSPLLRSGPSSWDYAAFLGDSARPLAAAWNRVSLALWGLPKPGSAAWPWRLEQLACLVAAALAARVFVQRCLTPWLGAESARSSAGAMALFMTLHPRALPAVAEIGTRGELLGVLLGLLGAALFLVGRQEEREGFTVAALVALVLAGFAGSVALLLALVLAAAEFCAVRRHRKRGLRLRTALTTAAVFGSGAALALSLGPHAGDSFGAALEPVRTLRAELLACGEDLGALVLPVEGLGAAAAALALILLLVAVQPAFHSARHAPRLWGGMLLGGSVLLGAALVWRTVSVTGSVLLASTFWAAGLAVTATALVRGRTRIVVPVLAVGWAILLHARARPWLEGATIQATLREELAALQLDPAARVLVLDPPGPKALWRDAGWLFHPRLEGSGEPTDFDPRRVRMLSSSAFLTLLCCSSTEELQASRPTVVVPAKELSLLQPGWCAVPLSPSAARTSELQRPWRQLTYTPEEPLDPLRWEHARIVAELASPAHELEQLAWSTRERELGPCLGFVTERAGRRVAEFDLSRSLAWRLAGSVRSLQVKRGVRSIERGELHARLPELGGVGAPEVEGEDWCFRPPEGTLEPGGRFTLVLLSLADFELLELPVVPEASGLRAHGAQGFAARASTAAPVAWLLEYRIGPQALLRTRGSVP